MRQLKNEVLLLLYEVRKIKFRLHDLNFGAIPTPYTATSNKSHYLLQLREQNNLPSEFRAWPKN